MRGNKCRGYLPKTRFHTLVVGFRVEVLRFLIFGLCLKFAFCMFPSLFIIIFCCNHFLPLQHSFWSFFQCVVKTMNVTFRLSKLFRTNQFPLVSMANLKHLVLQEGTCGYGAFPFNIHFCLHFGWGCTLGENMWNSKKRPLC